MHRLATSIKATLSPEVLLSHPTLSNITRCQLLAARVSHSKSKPGETRPPSCSLQVNTFPRIRIRIRIILHRHLSLPPILTLQPTRALPTNPPVQKQAASSSLVTSDWSKPHPILSYHHLPSPPILNQPSQSQRSTSTVHTPPLFSPDRSINSRTCGISR